MADFDPKRLRELADVTDAEIAALSIRRARSEALRAAADEIERLRRWVDTLALSACVGEGSEEENAVTAVDTDDVDVTPPPRDCIIVMRAENGRPQFVQWAEPGSNVLWTHDRREARRYTRLEANTILAWWTNPKPSNVPWGVEEAPETST